jgi:hypothetical protein
MKNAFIAVLFLSFSLSFSYASKANDPYRAYLLSRIYMPIHAIAGSLQQKSPVNELAIPRYKIPAGNVFCIMEDKLTKATKVWITVGVK